MSINKIIYYESIRPILLDVIKPIGPTLTNKIINISFIKA